MVPLRRHYLEHPGAVAPIHAMPELSKDFIALLQYLVPGFIVAWVFFGITAYAKPVQFERVVQALIHTVLIQALVTLEKGAALFLGQWMAIASWTNSSDLLASLVTAFILGFALSIAVHRDFPFRHLRMRGYTLRSGHPCHWYAAFSRHNRYVALQLKDGTRIFGWPSYWPTQPGQGHFFITSAARTAGHDHQDLLHLEGILINATDVVFVEFFKEEEPGS